MAKARPPEAITGGPSPERAVRQQGYEMVAGVDEAGRGPLAGPVVAGAVILPRELPPLLDGLDDSKKLSPKTRERLAGLIKAHALTWAVASCDAREIERLNILRASLTAMARAVEQLSPTPGFLLIDGNHTIESSLPQQAVVGGDALCPSISAASILAKVHRDHIMLKAHESYPEYNFASNKGYGTAEHKAALERVGPCVLHRKTFKPVAQMSLGLGGDEPTLGQEAETLSRAYLERKGLKVIAQNVRTGAGELDLVAKDGEVLVFVEVKARSGGSLGRPEEAVDGRKQSRLLSAARAYLSKQAQPWPVCRFDVVAVDYGRRGVEIRHLPDAFRDGEGG